MKDLAKAFRNPLGSELAGTGPCGEEKTAGATEAAPGDKVGTPNPREETALALTSPGAHTGTELIVKAMPHWTMLRAALGARPAFTDAELERAGWIIVRAEHAEE